MEPVIAARLFESQRLLTNAVNTLRTLCVEGIKANADHCRAMVERSIGLVTALNPHIGYERSTELAAEAMRTGKGIVELIREKKLLSEREIAALLDPAVMAGKRRVAKRSGTVRRK